MRRLICSTIPVTPLMRARSPIAHLILEDQEEPRDHVAHQVLRAEADGQPGDAGAGEDRHDVDRQLAQQHQDRDEPDRDA